MPFHLWIGLGSYEILGHTRPDERFGRLSRQIARNLGPFLSRGLPVGNSGCCQTISQKIRDRPIVCSAPITLWAGEVTFDLGTPDGMDQEDRRARRASDSQTASSSRLTCI